MNVALKNINSNIGGFKLKDISLTARSGKIFAILGPTGAGKTLLLETIAGFHLHSGSLLFGGKEMKNVPVGNRKAALLFQDYALFPHLTVERNIKFGLKYSGDRKEFQAICEMSNLGHLLKRKPSTLSGGEQQRVALARAVITKPRLLLLDEPFSSVDEKTADDLRADIIKILKKECTTAIFVTHNQREAMQVADRIAVMRDGKIEQIGNAEDVYYRPESDFVAHFTGMKNILRGKVISRKEGLARISVGGKEIEAVTEKSGKVTAFIRPEEITLKNRKQKTSALNTFEGRIAKIRNLGTTAEVEISCGFLLTSIVTKKSLHEIGLKKGKKVYASFKATAVHVIES